MQVILWVAEGLSVGWITGKMMSGIGRDLVLDSVMGAAGGVVGGFIVFSFGFLGAERVIYTNLAAMVGAIGFTAVTRLMSGRSESGATD